MLVEKTNQLIEEVNELKDLCIKEMNSEMIEHMDENIFNLYKKTFKLLNTSMEIMNEQAKIIESINEKLDKLLKQNSKQD